MENGLYRNETPVKILGTEENLYHIEFENGTSILCEDSELIILKN